MTLPDVSTGSPHVAAHNAERALINALQAVDDPDFLTNLSERIRDLLATVLIPGSNVTITPNDNDDTVTISATASGGTSGLDAEAVRDLLATVLIPGSNVTITPNDNDDTVTISATTSGGGGATTLDSLTDVNSPTPGDGYVLTYDLASGQWVPKPGGGAVGSWDSNKTVTFTPPPWVESTDLSLAVPLVKPAAAQIQVTVTEAMLTTASDAAATDPIQFSQQVIVYATVNNQANTGTNYSLSYELTKNGVLQSNADQGGHNNTRRSTVIVSTDVVVGDVLRLFLWNASGNSNGASIIDMWARGGNASRIGRGTPPAGGRYLFRDVTYTRYASYIPAWSPAWGGPFANGAGSDSLRLYDNGGNYGNSSGIDPYRTFISGAVDGLMRPYRGDIEQHIFSSAGFLQAGGVATLTFDRLAVPVPPV